MKTIVEIIQDDQRPIYATIIRPDGLRAYLRALDQVSVLAWVDDAAGPMPTEPQLGASGQMVQTSVDNNGFPVYTWVADQTNSILGSLYATKCQAWQIRYANLQAMALTAIKLHKGT